MRINSIHRRRGTTLTGVLGMLALVGAIVCVCLGMQEQGRTARPDAASVNLAAAPADQTVPIEQIRVGRRVLAGNPEMTAGQLDQISEIVPDQWRKVALEMTKPDGGRLDIVLLRPASWLLTSGAQTGDEIHLDMPELGAVGPAKVVSIQPCPQILPGGGRVVTGTFAHRAGNVVDLTIEGQSAPIGTTSNHPFWSEDRQAFIEAGELRQGELLRTLDGFAHVVSIIPRAGPEAVYNIEVHGEHVYHVGLGGVLVHNQYGMEGGWKSRRAFRGDTGLKNHARRHSNLSPKDYLARGQRNITNGRTLKGGGRSPSSRYHIRRVGDDDYSMTITNKNGKILSIDTWGNGSDPITRADLLAGFRKSGVTPPKNFWEKF